MPYNSAIDWLGTASGPLLAVELLAFCALLIVAFACSPKRTREPAGALPRTARVTLDEHLAKGELTREQYVDRRKALDFSSAIV